MIKFQLKCIQNHNFESWFSDSQRFEQLLSQNLLSCPVCGSQNVTRALMAPNIQTAKSKSKQDREANSTPIYKETANEEAINASLPAPSPYRNSPLPLSEDQIKILRKMKDFVSKNTENVGGKFAEEARKIHYQETEARPISGIATMDEAKNLIEEGIEVLPVPNLPEDLN